MLGMPNYKVRCEVCGGTGDFSAPSVDRAREMATESGWTFKQHTTEPEKRLAYCRKHPQRA